MPTLQRTKLHPGEIFSLEVIYNLSRLVLGTRNTKEIAPKKCPSSEQQRVWSLNIYVSLVLHNTEPLFRNAILKCVFDLEYAWSHFIYSHFRPALIFFSKLLSLSTKSLFSEFFRRRYTVSAHAYWVALKSQENISLKQQKTSTIFN